MSGTDRQLTQAAESKVCDANLRADGNRCGKPAKYQLIPLGTEPYRPLCGVHARHYDTKWLVKI